MAISDFCNFPVRQMRMEVKGEERVDLAFLQLRLHTLHNR
jgi:hypothetical protein